MLVQVWLPEGIIWPSCYSIYWPQAVWAAILDSWINIIRLPVLDIPNKNANWKAVGTFYENEIEIASFGSVSDQIISGSYCEIKLTGPRHVAADFDKP